MSSELVGFCAENTDPRKRNPLLQKKTTKLVLVLIIVLELVVAAGGYVFLISTNCGSTGLRRRATGHQPSVAVSRRSTSGVSVAP